MNKKFKKIISLLTTLIFILGGLYIQEASNSIFNFSTNVSAGSITYKGIEYVIYDGKAKIIKCEENATEVEIPSEINRCPVTTIGDNAFYGCNELTSIIILNPQSSV